MHPKIGHLPGSTTGPADKHVGADLAARLTVQAREGERILVEEKLDGACALVERRGALLVALSREGTLAAQSSSEGRRRFAAWVAAQAERFAWLAHGERVAGEWLAPRHGTRYALPHGPFVVFDLYQANGVRLARHELTARADGRLPQPALLHQGEALEVAAALARLGEHGHHGALDPAEGVIYRLERGDRVLHLAKWVRPGGAGGPVPTGGAADPPAWNTWRDDAT